MNAQSSYTKPEAYFQRLQTIIGLNLLVQFFFLILSVGLAKSRVFLFQESQVIIADVFGVLTPFFMVVTTVLGMFMFGKLLAPIDRKPKLVDKLDQYETAAIIRWTIFAVPNIFSLIILVLTDDMIFLVYYLIMFVICGLTWPTHSNVVHNAQLNTYYALKLEEKDFDLHEKPKPPPNEAQPDQEKSA